jgi:hypothetical protein
MEFTFSGKITFEDYVQFNKFILRKQILLRLIVSLFSFIVVSASLVLNNDSLFDNATFLLVFCLLLLFTTIMRVFLAKGKYRKVFDSHKTIEEECHFIINEKNITISSESNNDTLTEEIIYKIMFDKDSIYIFESINIAKMIKKRFLKDDEEYEKLVVFIKENYKNVIHKKVKPTNPANL